MRLIFHIAIYFSLLAGGLNAQAVSLFNDGAIFVSARTESAKNSPALFIGRDTRGMFSQQVGRAPVLASPGAGRLGGADVMVIRAMIEEAESRRDGYDAVQFGATIKPPRRPTEMTLAQIFKWIKDTPGQPHAIGRYQFIPATLRRVVEKAGIPETRRFNAQVQDRLADVLLREAGLERFRDGTLSRKGFMNNLAKIWAGLPNSTGKSHYHGIAGNKASVTWTRFEAVMAQIGPERG